MEKEVGRRSEDLHAGHNCLAMSKMRSLGPLCHLLLEEGLAQMVSSGTPPVSLSLQVLSGRRGKRRRPRDSFLSGRVRSGISTS